MGIQFLGKNIAILLLLLISVSCNNQDTRHLDNISDVDTIVVDIQQLSDLLKKDNLTIARKAVIDLVSNPVKNSFVLDSFLVAHSNLVNDIFAFEDDEAQTLFLSNLDYNSMYNTLSQAASHVISKGPNTTSNDLRDLAYFFKASENLLTKDIDSLAFYIGLVNIDSSQYLNQHFRPAYYNVLASYHQLSGNYFQAVVNFHLAIQNITAENKQNFGHLYHNLADLYSDFQYYEKADSIMEYCIYLLPPSQIDITKRITLGTLKMRLNKLDTAQVLFESILADPELSYQPHFRAMVYANLGNVNRRMKRFDRALQFFDKSDSVCAANGIAVGFLINSVNRGEAFLDLEDLDAAGKQLNKALDYLKLFPVKSFEAETYKLLTRYYDDKGQKTLADHFFRKYTLVKDELMGDETKAILAEWELNNVKSANQLQSLLKDQEAQQLRNQKKLILLFAAFLLTATVFFFAHRQRKQQLIQEKILREKEKLEFNLELKSKELLVETMKNFTVQNTKAGIGTILNELVETLPKIQQAKFKDLQHELRIRKEVSHFKEFDQRFTSIHENFYQSINALAPNLSPSELRICALMRMNLTTKDIANLTNRTPGRVDNVRSSIRKKLQLPDNENLQSFIMKI